jgi:hypothetical protein
MVALLDSIALRTVAWIQGCEYYGRTGFNLRMTLSDAISLRSK